MHGAGSDPGFFKGGGGANSNAWPLRHDEGRVQEGDVPPPVLCAEIFAKGCLREPRFGMFSVSTERTGAPFS